MSGPNDNVNLGSNKWVNTIASIVLLIVGTVAAIVLERMGDLQNELGSMTEAVSRIEELEDVKERLVKLELGDRVISHAQLSSTQTQYPTADGNFIDMNSVDSIAGDIEFLPRISPNEVRMLADGSVLILAVPQVRRLPGYAGTACITVWMVINGKNVQNSSIKNCISEDDDERDTMTTTLQAILPVHKDDVLQLKMRSDPQGQIGIVALHPKDVPVVPSIIFSVMKMGG
jgi:predicted SnoaL-like aldol condensation-catalyzing enzyme